MAYHNRQAGLFSFLRQTAQEDGGYKGLPLRLSDRLRVTAGPPAGMEAIFERRLFCEERARVLIETMGRLTACEIALAWLERPRQRPLGSLP